MPAICGVIWTVLFEQDLILFYASDRLSALVVWQVMCVSDPQLIVGHFTLVALNCNVCFFRCSR